MAVLNEASKIGIAINGGAAVAMGALLQALLNAGARGTLRSGLLWGIAVTTFGVLTGTLVFLFRYLSLVTSQDNPVFGNRWGVVAFVAGIAALFAFVIGVAIPLTIGFLRM